MDDVAQTTDLPTGTVTFLLTDVESSTPRWDAEPEAMAAAMEQHDRLLDEAITKHGGARPREQGEGDDIVAAFARASDAVHAALDAQQALSEANWPTETPLAVRMGIHTGEARLTAAGYAGPATSEPPKSGRSPWVARYCCQISSERSPSRSSTRRC